MIIEVPANTEMLWFGEYLTTYKLEACWGQEKLTAEYTFEGEIISLLLGLSWRNT